MSKIIAAFLLSAVALSSLAQQTGGQLTETTRDVFNRGGLTFNSTTSFVFLGVKSPKGDVVGATYLDSTWQAGSIKLYQKVGPPGREGDSISNVPLRLDLYTNELEISAGEAKDIRAVNGNQVRFFTMTAPERRIFLNVKEFRSDDKLTGFVELVKAGRLSLVELTKLSIIKPSYNEAMSLGSKDTKIVKNRQYYVVKGNTLVQIGTSKKKLLDAMADRADDVEAFIKSNDLSLKSRSDIMKIFAYYNNL